MRCKKFLSLSNFFPAQAVIHKLKHNICSTKKEIMGKEENKDPSEECLPPRKIENIRTHCIDNSREIHKS